MPKSGSRRSQLAAQLRSMACAACKFVRLVHLRLSSVKVRFNVSTTSTYILHCACAWPHCIGLVVHRRGRCPHMRVVTDTAAGTMHAHARRVDGSRTRATASPTRVNSGRIMADYQCKCCRQRGACVTDT